MNAGQSSRDIYYYRDADQREIDLILEVGRTIHPIEIKLSAKPNKRMVQAFHLLEPITSAGDRQIGDGAVINQLAQVMFLNEGIRAVPIGSL